MKKSILLPLLVFILIQACKQSDLPAPEVISEEYTIKLNLGGDISFADVPLGRTTSNGEVTYYFIQINDLQGGIHASGIFDHIPTDLEVTLFKDRTYNTQISAYRKGTGFGLWVNSDSILYINRDTRIIKNALSYTESLGFAVNQSSNIRLYSDADSVSIKTTSSSSSFINEVDAFYGSTVVDSSFHATDSTVAVDLIRNTMGYEIKVNNLSSGSIIVNIGGTSDRFNHGSDSSSTRYFVSRFLTNDSSFYNRNFNVLVSHLDTVQSIPVNTTLFSSSVPFKRLHKKLIDINAPADTTGGSSNNNNYGFNINIEDIPLIDGDTLTIN